MSRNYTASTRDRIGDLVTGLRVDTSVVSYTPYLAATQTEIFNVFGRIMIMELYMEVITELGANATTLQFNYTSTTPSILVEDLCALSTDVLTSSDVGDRMQHPGGAVLTVATLSATECIGDEHCAAPQIIGMESGIGTVGVLSAGTNNTQGTIQFSIHYVPMSDGAYVTAAV